MRADACREWPRGANPAGLRLGFELERTDERRPARARRTGDEVLMEIGGAGRKRAFRDGRIRSRRIRPYSGDRKGIRLLVGKIEGLAELEAGRFLIDRRALEGPFQ